jgi:hypothetical protein
VKLHQLSQANTGKLLFGCELPGSGAVVWSFPRTSAQDPGLGGDGPVFRVTATPSWIGTISGSGGFALEWENWPSFVIVTDQFGFSINYADPTTFSELGFGGLSSSWTVSTTGDWLLVNDYIRLKCYRRGQKCWESDRLVLDDLRVDEIDATQVNVSGDHSALGISERVRLKLNLESGEFISGKPFSW